jgi:hypothetical protein
VFDRVVFKELLYVTSLLSQWFAFSVFYLIFPSENNNKTIIQLIIIIGNEARMKLVRSDKKSKFVE